MTCLRFRGVLALLLSLPTGVEVAAAPLQPGDILVPDKAGILRIDPSTGIQTIFASGGLLRVPFDLAFDPTGNLLVMDVDNARIPSTSLLRIDPISGTQTLLAADFFFPTHIAVDPLGNIFTLDVVGNGLAFIRVDPVTGARTVVAPGDNLIAPRDLALDAAGNLLLIDAGSPGRVRRIDPVTGAQTVVTTFDDPFDTFGIAVDAAGNILVSSRFIVSQDFYTGSVVRVDPFTGAQTVVSLGGLLTDPSALTLDADGSILVVNTTSALFSVGGTTFSFPASVVRIDPVTGVQTLVSSGGSLINPHSIVIVPQVQAVPEPAGIILGSVGAVVLLSYGWRRRQRESRPSTRRIKGFFTHCSLLKNSPCGPYVP